MQRLVMVDLIFCCFVLLFSYGAATDEYYGSEYYYYEEESVEEVSDRAMKVNVDDTSSPMVKTDQAESQSKYGYHRYVGNSIDILPLLTADYLNFTFHEYKCVLQKDYYVKSHLLTAEELEELELEGEGAGGRGGRESAEDVVNRIRGSRTSKEVEEARLKEEEERRRVAELEELAALTQAKQRRGKEKKLTFREIELLKIERKKAEIAKHTRVQKLFNLGPSCERLACHSCRLVVREFGLVVLNSVRDPRFLQIAEIARSSFCDREQIYLQYNLQAYDICALLMEEGGGYLQRVAMSFDQVDSGAVYAAQNQHTLPGYNPQRRRLYWDFVEDNRDEYFYLREEQICVGIGACDSFADFSIAGVVIPPPPPPEPEDDDEPLEPEDPSIKRRAYALKNETCAVCHAAILSMEARVLLQRHVTDATVDATVASTCERIGLFAHISGPQREMCEALVLGKHKSSLGWMLKMHAENVVRKTRKDILFADQVCDELNFCPRWVDPVEVKRVVERTLDAVYS